MFKYFFNHIEYPNIASEDEILPDGVLYCYVPSVFLAGFVNYIKAKQIYLITRYRMHEENIKSAKEFNTKAELYVDLNDVDDDVLILGRRGKYNWFFWVDKDSSDCKIGRFTTATDWWKVVEDFENYANELSLKFSVENKEDTASAIELDIKENDWIKI